MSEQQAADPRGRGAGDKQPAPRPMSDREVRSVSGVLVKEARRILKKHAQRIAPEPCEAIRESATRLAAHREAGAWSDAREEVEVLDELLHQHASFARKGVIRELVENIGIAVLVALALRSCFYEPFKIPSGSMMPTLRNGDHIFVNKFVYGVQIPFTTTVVGKQLGEIKRGDVIVFRYPIDPSEDFIKRVIGLPGDVVRVDGSEVAVKRAGSEEFVTLARRKLDEPCRDELGKQIVPRCTLYEEDNGDRAYVVRYEPNFDPRTGGPAQRRGEWSVPAGQLLVMGDNRNHSHDSLAWTKVVEAVAADGVISVRDLRDLTPETLFKLTRPESTSSGDPRSDHVLYFAEHRSPKHAVELSVWREPSLGVDTIYDTVVEGFGAGAEATTLEALFEGATAYHKSQPQKQAQVARATEAITAMTVAEQGEDGFDGVIKLAAQGAVIQFRCGSAACNSREMFGRRIANVLDGYVKDPGQDARELEIGASHIRYSQHWTSRGRVIDKFLDRRFTQTGAAGGRASTVRLRAWRDTDEGDDFLRDASLRAVGSSTASASAVAEDGIQRDSWLAQDEEALTLVSSYRTAGVTVMLECGRQLCADEPRLYELARAVAAKVPAAARDRRRLKELLVAGDIKGWREVPEEDASAQRKYEFDRLRLDGTVRSERYSVGVWARKLEPGEDAAAAVTALADELHESAPSGAVVDGGIVGATSGGGYGHVFAIPETSVVVRVDCSEGLCPTAADAEALARRAADKARDESNFIDPNAERPYPYVPRGNVKGRADRIWLPLRRFWLPIR
ncbi:MAG: signal peptidase I [Myxococcales bacterium]|nr:signal peptidase I [Myxococcales bacterium]